MGDVNFITKYKWNKFIAYLNVVRDATWPEIDSDVVIWELIDDTKALPS